MPLKPPRAAVIDRSHLFRTMAAACLRSLGWDYACFESGYEAIEYFMRGGMPFEVILVDRDLPLLSGVETVEAVELLAEGQRFILIGEDPPGRLPRDCRFMRRPVDFPLLVRFLKSVERARMMGESARAGGKAA